MHYVNEATQFWVILKMVMGEGDLSKQMIGGSFD